MSIVLFGPLPETKEGYRWIFVVKDIASRWVELIPLKVASAEAVVRSFIDEVILRFGVPRRVISIRDNGAQFVGSVMQQVAYCLGFQQNLIPVYHSEANPVERKNRDLKAQLARLTSSNHTQWVTKNRQILHEHCSV